MVRSLALGVTRRRAAVVIVAKVSLNRTVQDDRNKARSSSCKKRIDERPALRTNRHGTIAHAPPLGGP